MPPHDSLQSAVNAAVSSRDTIKAAAEALKAEDAKPAPLPVGPSDFIPRPA